MLEALFNTAAGLRSAQDCNFIKKEPPTQVFSCEFCGILKMSFYRTRLVAASKYCRALS